VVYERSPANVQAAVSKAYDNLKSDPKADPYQAVPSVRNPGSLLRQLVDGDYQINRIFEMLEQDSQNHSDIIDALAKDHGLCWVPVSELATTSQAYCSIFWDPLAKWMVVVFKLASGCLLLSRVMLSITFRPLGALILYHSKSG
jgi:hypothetical protein